ncbi:hypothetical protein [Nocardioides jiangxiensis]|uniref:DUF1918 domain-containing protein n=1 Tax=Nocardioides jiangxiensis TaxID=3064524 RepID=A0ABT9B8I7_9ACTN|nr:hypothetical protein [Nocardioides sp. WY-20]MDO7869596.1 hypothetical protein [Nocardioides sp. WY-20]
MSGIDVGSKVRITGEGSPTGTVVSWDDTRSEYLVEMADGQSRYVAQADLEPVSGEQRP